MAMERTLTIIKPDAVAAGNAGHIIAHLEREGFEILAMQKITLTPAQAREFYAVHRERPFYGSLVEFMTSGPIIPMVLERDNAIAGLREVMGATNPRDAAEGTVRKLYASNIEQNAIHGSDSPENATVERAFFFSALEQG
jgi:nucleoside-diphosphate kinase